MAKIARVKDTCVYSHKPKSILKIYSTRVYHGHMHGILVSFTVNSHCANSHFLGRSHYSACDFSTISNQHFVNLYCIWRMTCVLLMYYIFCSISAQRCGYSSLLHTLHYRCRISLLVADVQNCRHVDLHHNNKKWMVILLLQIEPFLAINIFCADFRTHLFSTNFARHGFEHNTK